MENTKTQIKINGIKLEVDLRNATRIDEFKVGDNVKVLMKNYDTWLIRPGVIVDFVNFKELPTIHIAIWKDDTWGSNSNIEFRHYNSNSKDIEISLALPHELQLEKSRVIDRFNAKIQEHLNRAEELKSQMEWFTKYYNKYFNEIETNKI